MVVSSIALEPAGMLNGFQLQVLSASFGMAFSLTRFSFQIRSGTAPRSSCSFFTGWSRGLTSFL